MLLYIMYRSPASIHACIELELGFGSRVDLVNTSTLCCYIRIRIPMTFKPALVTMTQQTGQMLNRRGKHTLMTGTYMLSGHERETTFSFAYSTLFKQ